MQKSSFRARSGAPAASWAGAGPGPSSVRAWPPVVRSGRRQGTAVPLRTQSPDSASHLATSSPGRHGHGARRAPLCRSGAGGPASGAGTAFGDPNSVMGMLMAYAVQMQQQQQAAGAGGAAPGAEVRVEGLTFHPPGAEQPLLQDIRMTLPANSLGLVMGRSGSGKTTLLQVLAGLSEQTSGQVRVLRGGAAGGVALPPTNGYAGGNGNGSGAHAPAAAAAGGPGGLTMEERMQQVGLVFQFPERHFLGEDLLQVRRRSR